MLYLLLFYIHSNTYPILYTHAYNTLSCQICFCLCMFIFCVETRKTKTILSNWLIVQQTTNKYTHLNCSHCCPMHPTTTQQQEQDPTNLYIANLPPHFKETDLEAMLAKYGQVVSTRILRDQQMNSKGNKTTRRSLLSLFNIFIYV